MRKLLKRIPCVVGGLMIAASVMAQSEVTQSGYLQDYAQLQPDPERPGVFTYESMNFKPGQYDAIIVGSIELWWAPDSKYKGIQPERAQEVTTNFRRRLEEWIGTRKKVVRQPGPGVLLLNVAITNMKAERPNRKLLNYTPVGLAVTGAKKARGNDYALADAYLEGELINSKTGEDVAMIVVTNLGERITRLRKNVKISWDTIEEDLNDYAKQFSEDLLR